eukprot:RCo010762
MPPSQSAAYGSPQTGLNPAHPAIGPTVARFPFSPSAPGAGFPPPMNQFGSQPPLSTLPQHLPHLEQPQASPSSVDVFQGCGEPNALSREKASELLILLDDLSGSKDSIRNAKNWIMDHRQFATSCASILERKMPSCDGQKKVHLVYLLSDILHNCLKKGFDDVLRAVQSILPLALASSVLGNDEENVSKISKVVALWEQRQLFPENVVQQLQDAVRGATAAPTPTAPPSTPGPREESPPPPLPLHQIHSALLAEAVTASNRPPPSLP